MNKKENFTANFFFGKTKNFHSYSALSCLLSFPFSLKNLSSLLHVTVQCVLSLHGTIKIDAVFHRTTAPTRLLIFSRCYKTQSDTVCIASLLLYKKTSFDDSRFSLIVRIFILKVLVVFVFLTEVLAFLISLFWSLSALFKSSTHPKSIDACSCSARFFSRETWKCALFHCCQTTYNSLLKKGSSFETVQN